jgi:hypothetical protein
LRFERSQLSGFRLAELVASVGDEYRLGPPSWLGIAWYALPLAAVASWIALFVPGPMRVRRAHGPLAAGMVALSAGFAVAAARTVGVCEGEIVALVGSVVALGGSVRFGSTSL